MTHCILNSVNHACPYSDGDMLMLEGTYCVLYLCNFHCNSSDKYRYDLQYADLIMAASKQAHKWVYGHKY